MITTGEFKDLVENTNIAFWKGYDKVDAIAESLYNVSKTDSLMSVHSEMEMSEYAHKKDEGGKHHKAELGQGYTVIFRQEEEGEMISVTKKMRVGDKYDEISRLVTSIGKAQHRRIELNLTHQFTFGAAGSYTNMDGDLVLCKSGDGLPYFHTAHTLTKSNKTYSNLLTNNGLTGTAEQNRTALSNAERLFVNMKNNFGQRLSIRPDTIITSDDPDIVNAVQEMLYSTVKTDGSNGTINVNAKKYEHLILPDLDTDSNGVKVPAKAGDWFLVSKADSRAIMEVAQAVQLTPPNINANSEDFDTESWSWKVNAMYSYGWLDSKFVVRSNE